MTLVVAGVLVLSSCGDDGAVSPDTVQVGAANPRPPTEAEAQRLAISRVNAYQAGTRSFDGVVMSDDRSVQLRGWIDTADHWGYALATGADLDPFLVAWNESVVNAQSFTGTEPPLPAPADGWESVALDPEQSHLAAAQVLLVSLAGDRPENPQLLAQSGVRWLREDRIGQTRVDVFSGPVPVDATASSFRYWVDDDGDLLRLEARLDGVHWSSFNLADASDVTIEQPQ